MDLGVDMDMYMDMDMIRHGHGDKRGRNFFVPVRTETNRNSIYFALFAN
jgi:hypothetical protein